MSNQSVVRSEYALRSKRTKGVTSVFQSRALLEKHVLEFESRFNVKLKDSMDIVRIVTTHEVME